MAININHTKDTFFSNSGIFVFGTGITPNYSNTLYSTNFCVSGGAFFGNASGLKNINILTYPDEQNLTKANFILCSNGTITCSDNIALFNCDSTYISGGSTNKNFIYKTTCSIITANSSDNTMIGGFCNSISGACGHFFVGGYQNCASFASYNSIIFNGAFNCICATVLNSAILAGSSICAASSNTAYATNFCAFGGKFYGDGSALTGVGAVDLSSYITTGQTGNFITVDQTGNFITTGMTGSFGAGDLIFSCTTQYGTNVLINSSSVSLGGGVSNNVVINGCNNSIGMGASNNLIFGCINTSFSDSIIGCNFVACNNIRVGNKICSFGDIQIVEGYGSFIGDGSGLTGLATGNFITTDQTGAFGGGGDLSNYVTTGETGSFVSIDQTGNFITIDQTGDFLNKSQTGSFYSISNGLLDSNCNFEVKVSNLVPSQTGSGRYNTILQGGSNSLYEYAWFNFIAGSESSKIESQSAYNILLNTCRSNLNYYSTRNSVIGGTCHNILCYSENNSILAGRKNTIGQGNLNSVILGGCQNTIANSSMDYVVSDVVILGGCDITATSGKTAYANNFCAYEGKYYGDGSALTGVITQDIKSHSELILSGDPYPYTNIGTKNYSLLISAGQSCSSTSGHFVLDCLGYENYSVGKYDRNLYPISADGSRMYTFSTTVVGQSSYLACGLRPSAIKIEGVIFSGQILNQVKTIYLRDGTDDAYALIENGYLKINLSGLNNTSPIGKNWSAKLDILDSQVF